MRDFKKFMKMARLRAGFVSQQRAADAIGCERGTVGMWEAPSSAVEKLSGEFLMPTAIAYRVHPDSLSGASDDDRYPWSPEGNDHSLVTSQVRRLDLAILALAIENLGKSGIAADDALFAEYERLKALKVSDIAAKKAAKGDQDESDARRSAGAGGTVAGKGRRAAK